MPDPIKPTAADASKPCRWPSCITASADTCGYFWTACGKTAAIHAQQAREQALEEAAKVADRCPADEPRELVAAAIRTLRSNPDAG